MRNLLDESSDAQSLDENRLTGSLHFPVAVSSQSAAQTQEEQSPGFDEAVSPGLLAPMFRNNPAHSK